MENLTLYIGNKNTSSWSLRAWLALKFINVEYEEVLIPYNEEKGKEMLIKLSPTSQGAIFTSRRLGRIG